MPILTAEERLETIIDDRYRLDRILGSGGMGVVFAGEHVLTGRRVAVKVLKPQYVAEAELVARFFREARAAASIAHPNIIDVLDMGECDDGSAYQVLELLQGRTLAGHVSPDSPADPQWLMELILPVTDALQSAHSHGVIHRDLKPDNIFIAANGLGETVAKVLDFGIAKLVTSSGVTATEGGSIVGTPKYMSPEQAAGKLDVGPQTDIWALGLVLLEALAGVHPIVEENSTSLLIRIITEGVPPAAEVCPHIHPDLAQVLDRALQQEPEHRWQTMGEFGSALYDAARLAGNKVLYKPLIRRFDPSEPPQSGGLLQLEPVENNPELAPPSYGTGNDQNITHARSKLEGASGQAVTIVRPYGRAIGEQMFRHLREAGLVVQAKDIIRVGTTDDEAVRCVLESSNRVLIVPFHAHKDLRGDRVSGLSFLRMLDHHVEGDFRWKVVMPTSALGAASLTLALAREPMGDNLRDSILVVHEDELAAESLVGQILTHVA